MTETVYLKYDSKNTNNNILFQNRFFDCFQTLQVA